MSDIIERAEAAMKDAGTYWQPAAFGAGCLTLMPELVAEIERLRRNVRYLDLIITEEVGHLSPDESAELDNTVAEPIDEEKRGDYQGRW